MKKLKCSYWHCDWHGTDADVLSAPDPFNVGETLWACPKCKDQTIVGACIVHDCWNGGNCGGPNPYEPDGTLPFVAICGEHWRAVRAAPPAAREVE